MIPLDSYVCTCVQVTAKRYYDLSIDQDALTDYLADCERIYFPGY